jgi:hypothetical protein
VASALNRLDNAALHLGADTRLAARKDTPAAIQEAREQWDVFVVNIFGAHIATDAATATTLFALDIFGGAFDDIVIFGAIIVITVVIVIVIIVAVEIVIRFKARGGGRGKARRRDFWRGDLWRGDLYGLLLLLAGWVHLIAHGFSFYFRYANSSWVFWSVR